MLFNFLLVSFFCLLLGTSSVLLPKNRAEHLKFLKSLINSEIVIPSYRQSFYFSNVNRHFATLWLVSSSSLEDPYYAYPVVFDEIFSLDWDIERIFGEQRVNQLNENVEFLVHRKASGFLYHNYRATDKLAFHVGIPIEGNNVAQIVKETLLVFDENESLDAAFEALSVIINVVNKTVEFLILTNAGIDNHSVLDLFASNFGTNELLNSYLAYKAQNFTLIRLSIMNGLIKKTFASSSQSLRGSPTSPSARTKYSTLMGNLPIITFTPISKTIIPHEIVLEKSTPPKMPPLIKTPKKSPTLSLIKPSELDD